MLSLILIACGGGGNGGRGKNELQTTYFTVTIEVDYVRVYSGD